MAICRITRAGAVRTSNGIHMLLRIAHGQWPPTPAALTRVELYRRKQCEDFGTWLTEMRGLAAETVAERRDEARRFLGWLSENAIRTVAAIKVADVDAYMKNGQVHCVERQSKVWQRGSAASCDGFTLRSKPRVISLW